MIREARLKDIVSIFDIEKKAGLEPLGIDFLVSELENNPFSYYLVYEINNMIVGYVGSRLLDESIEIMNFAVLPEYQRQKIGTVLINKLKEKAREENKKQIILEVRKSNKIARSFYLKEGFMKIDIKKNYYNNGEDGYVMLWEDSL